MLTLTSFDTNFDNQNNNKMSLSTLRNPKQGQQEKTYEPKPPIPFTRQERTELRKDEYMSFKLRSIPNDPTSSEIYLAVPYFSTGSVEQFIDWDENRRAVIVGQNLVTDAQKYTFTRLTLKGDALAAFNAAANTYANENDPGVYDLAIVALFEHVFPRKALAIQKRYMQYRMPKWRSVSARKYSARVVEINSKLELFPPFGQSQELDEDALTQQHENNFPVKFLKEMYKQGYDPIDHTLQEFVEFAERLEVVDDIEKQASGPDKKASEEPSSSSKKRKRDKKEHSTPKRSSTSEKYCELHGKNPTHNTGECKTLISQAKKMRGSWENRSDSQKSQYRKDKRTNNAEMHAMVDKMVTRKLQTMVSKSKSGKKRKEVEDSSNFEAIDTFNFNFEKSDQEQSNDSDSEHSEWNVGQCDTSTNSRTTLNSLDQALNSKLNDSYSLASALQGHQRNPKRQRRGKLAPIAFGRLNTRIGTPKPKDIRVLVDSGGSQTIIAASAVKKLRLKKTAPTKWSTVSGSVTTDKTCNIQFTLPELQERRLIEWEAHVTPHPMNYDMIIGRDLCEELGLIIDFKKQCVTWDDISMPMKPWEADIDTHFHVHDSDTVDIAHSRISDILDAKYAPADLDQVVAECTHLASEEQQQLRALLEKHSTLFDGTLGKWRDEPYDVKLRPDAEPYHARAYPIPRAYEDTLKLEVDRLCDVGVLKKVNRSQWAAPTFIIPKKDGTVRFISDFRELNKRIKRVPYPIPKIQDLMLKLEGFQHATSLDLNMGYYHIELTPDSKKLCTIVLPWGKYEYQRLPMGLSNSPDIFQERMGTLMHDLEYVRAYIDDILCLTSTSFSDHLEKLDEVLKRLKNAGLKVNAKKSFFAKAELEYLGYWVTRKGIQPMPNKVDAIQKIKAPTNKRALRSFIGVINYYRDMWIRRSEVLAPLTELTGKDTKFVWTDRHQKSFDTMKRIISKETLLAYPNFNETFDIHTDASHTQLGAVISQDGKPIAFYSRKLNPAQTRYTTTERELLAIVETLKEFRNILLGQQIRVYTDHKNLTYKNFNTERVMRWRLIIEEFGPELIYIKGTNNIVADALSRLDMLPNTPNIQKHEEHLLFSMSENYASDDLPSDAFPLQYKYIEKFQLKDKPLLKNLEQGKYTRTPFHGGGTTRNLICYNGKIVVPSRLQQRVVTWYHNHLCHPGETRTEATIRQNFYWPKMRNHVHSTCKKCHTCQITKRNTRKYGKLPEKQAEAVPWDTLCIDLIGPYTIKRNGHSNDLTLWCVTMIDPATGWFEMKDIPTKRADYIANIVETTWLTRYPWPTQLVFDRGTEFMAEFAKMVVNDYGIKRKPITVRNPQANAIIERVHQTIGNMIRTFSVENMELDETDPWSGVLAATMFAIRATMHTTTQATPSQLVFGRDAILNTTFEANWKFIKDRKQKIIKKNNMQENKKRTAHEYQVHDRCLLKTLVTNKYGQPEYDGPYQILQIKDNGTVRVRKGAVTDTVNIRRIKPYFS